MYIFSKSISQTTFKLPEEIITKIKNTIFGNVNNFNVEEICKALKNNNNEIFVEIYPIKIQYKNKENIIENKEYNIILISHRKLIQNLDFKNATQFGLD